MHRFFVPAETLAAETVEIKDPALLHQLTRVLRLTPGGQVLLLDNNGAECCVEVTRVEKRTLFATVKERRAAPAEPTIFVTLFQAIPKQPSKLEEILQHGTEVGVSRFVPLFTDRSERRELKNRPRLEKVLREAAEQSERGRVPELAEAIKFETLFAKLPAGVNLLADSYATEPRLPALLPAARQSSQVNFYIGPEGGFTAREIAAATKASVQNFSLGTHILRTETAGVACVSALFFG